MPVANDDDDLWNVVPIRDEPPAWMDDRPPYEGEGEQPKPQPLVLIDPAAWAGSDAPTREWKVKDYIPDRQATLLTGKGAAGKSLVSQQMCTCIALGLPFLGIETVQTVAIYITCEDDADELHRRQKAICESLGVPIEKLSGKLFLLSLQGEMGNELATFDNDGRMRIASRYNQIVEAAAATEAGFVVLDNTAHTFTGNENDRHQVASFINLCNRLAISVNGAVVIVGHPNKAGDSYSGSTAWENQVRSRLFMEIPVDDNDVPEHADLRIMRREKVNYAQRGGELRFMWHHGAFVLEQDIPESKRMDIAQVAQDAEENDRFLKCLAAATRAKRAVSHINGINYYGTQFMRMTEAKGMKKHSFEMAFERLLHLGLIELDAELWKGPNRHMKTGIKATEKCANPSEPPKGKSAPTPASTPRANPRQPHSQVIENVAPTLRAPTPLYTTYISDGVGPEAEPPSWMDEAPPIDLNWRDNPILNEGE